MEAIDYVVDHLQFELGRRNLIISEKHREVIKLRSLLTSLVAEFKEDLQLSGRGAYLSYHTALPQAEKYLNPPPCNTPGTVI